MQLVTSSLDLFPSLLDLMSPYFYSVGDFLSFNLFYVEPKAFQISDLGGLCRCEKSHQFSILIFYQRIYSHCLFIIVVLRIDVQMEISRFWPYSFLMGPYLQKTLDVCAGIVSHHLTSTVYVMNYCLTLDEQWLLGLSLVVVFLSQNSGLY